MTQLQYHGFVCPECNARWYTPQPTSEQTMWAVANDHLVRMHQLVETRGDGELALRRPPVRYILSSPASDKDGRWVPQTHVAWAQAFVRGCLFAAAMEPRVSRQARLERLKQYQDSWGDGT